MNSIELKPKEREIYTLNEFIFNELGEENHIVNLIAEEIFVNIAKYSKADYIKVNAEFDEPTLKLEFIDNGTKFNPILKEDPKTPENIEETPIGGLGIFLTKQLADDLKYCYVHGENHLKIIKKVGHDES